MKNELLREIKELLLNKGENAVEVICWKFGDNSEERYIVRTENNKFYEYHIVGGYTSHYAMNCYRQMQARGSVCKTTKKEWNFISNGKYELITRMVDIIVVEREVL